MENEAAVMSNKDMKVQIPSPEVISPTSGMISGGGGLARQTSINSRQNCLCSPTTHAGSFRCRLHRSPSLQRTKSIDPQSAQTNAVDAQL